MAPRRSLRAVLLVLLCACEPSTDPAPEPRGSPAPPSEAAGVEEETRAAQDGLTLSIRRVAQDGWRGRLVVASLAPEVARAARVVPSDAPRPLRRIVAERAPPQPFAAIDGGFYDPHGDPMGLVRTGGVDRHPLTDGGGSGIFVLGDDGPRIVHRDAYDARGVREALQSIDRLVVDGRSVVGEGASDRRAARSAVALDADGALHLAVAFDDEAVVDEGPAHVALGVASGRTGPTLAQWAALLARDAEDGGVGAADALGLDGGFSTSMVVKSAARSLRVEAHRATIGAIVVSAR
ncbi:MAG TPA: phosphodiester glycosidase family protein [Sandaracinaceae bacterium LLY-WYZ-13_1]|nr:phosphodiester glycosidase family protein [Sandaracinaceae bacterium LLY-WYZ-13_1]